MSLFDYQTHTHRKKNSIVPPLNLQKKHTKSQTQRSTNDSVTLLSIRLPSVTNNHTIQRNSQFLQIHHRGQESPQKSSKSKSQSKQKSKLLHIQYKKRSNPGQYLQNIGYSRDARLPSEKYEDRVNENKKKFINKMELLKKNINRLNQENNEEQTDKKFKNRINGRIFAEQLRRSRQSLMLRMQEKKSKRIFNSMILSRSQ